MSLVYLRRWRWISTVWENWKITTNGVSFWWIRTSFLWKIGFWWFGMPWQRFHRKEGEEGLPTETITEEVVVNKNRLTYCRCADLVQHSVRLKSFFRFPIWIFRKNINGSGKITNFCTKKKNTQNKQNIWNDGKNDKMCALIWVVNTNGEDFTQSHQAFIFSEAYETCHEWSSFIRFMLKRKTLFTVTTVDKVSVIYDSSSQI
jgi:hypothetical protein